MDEVTILAYIQDHPNITQFFGLVSPSEGHAEAYIVMKFFDGGSLRGVLNDYPDRYSFREKCHILMQVIIFGIIETPHSGYEIAAGVGHLHKHDTPVLHRDIACRNNSSIFSPSLSSFFSYSIFGKMIIKV